MSHAHKVGAVESPAKKQITAEQREELFRRKIEKQTNAIEVELERLKEQMKEKRRELQTLRAAEEEQKRDRLVKAIARSGKSIDEIIETLEA